MRISTFIIFTYVSVMYFCGLPCLTKWMGIGMTIGYVLFTIYTISKAAVEQHFDDQRSV